MKSDERFSDMLDKTILFGCLNENVIRFPNQNTLNTKVKQIRNPQKEISGGFFYFKYLSKVFLSETIVKSSK